MSRYAFNASALGLGGVLTSGSVRTTIPSLASVALAPTGGEGSSVVENYNCHGISFTRAESRVFGTDLSEGVYTTYADVYITNLTIFDRLRIALMGATVTSTRNVENGESLFEVRVTYRGISAEGNEVIPVLDYNLCNAPTYGDFVNALNGEVDRYADSFGVQPAALRSALQATPAQEPLAGTLVSDYRIPADCGIVRSGSAIVVPGIGRAHFGEFLFKPGRRRVNLLRLKLGAFEEGAVALEAVGDGGDLTAGSVEGNGTPPIP